MSKKAIITLSVPLLVEYALNVSMGSLTSMMVSSVGTAAFSAVGYINIASDLAIAIFMALGTGAAVVIAQSVGGEQFDRVKKISEQALLLAGSVGLAVAAVLLLLAKPIIAGLLGQAEPAVFQCGLIYFVFSVLSYPFQAIVSLCSGALRGTGNTKPGMYMTGLMNLVNVLVGALLIFGFRMGIWGAGIAILTARAVGALAGILIMRKINPRYAVVKLSWRFDWSIQKSILVIGLPVAVEGLLFNGGRFLSQTFIVGMGTAQMAANALTNTLMSIVLIPATALGYAATTVVGMDIGSGRSEGARKDLRFILRLSIYSASVFCAVFALFLPQILGIFRPEPEVFAITRECMLYVIAASVFIWPLGFVTPYGLKGAGDVAYTTAVALFSMFAFRVLLGYFFGVTLGLKTPGVIMATVVDWGVRAILFYSRLWGKQWLKHQAVA